MVEDTGIRSIASYRLYFGPHRRAALTFYSDWPYAFDESAVATGAIFAAYASLALGAELHGEEPTTSTCTAHVQPEIDLAVELLAGPDNTSTQAATRALHTAGRHLQRALSEPHLVLDNPPSSDDGPD